MARGYRSRMIARNVSRMAPKPVCRQCFEAGFMVPAHECRKHQGEEPVNELTGSQAVDALNQAFQKFNDVRRG